MTPPAPSPEPGPTPVRIQRSRAKGWRMPENTVYVGRPTKWGNPYVVGEPLRSNLGGAPIAFCMMDAETATAVYRYHLTRQRQNRKMLADARRELRGKNLACWCPIISHGEYEPCHADVLLSIANDIPMEEVIRENTRRSKGEAVR